MVRFVISEEFGVRVGFRSIKISVVCLGDAHEQGNCVRTRRTEDVRMRKSVCEQDVDSHMRIEDNMTKEVDSLLYLVGIICTDGGHDKESVIRSGSMRVVGNI